MRTRAVGGCLLAAVLALATACGETGSRTSAPAYVGQPATAGASPTATESPTEDPTPTETPTKDPGAPVLAGGWCSDELVQYMVDNSTSLEFKRGFGLPALLEGLDVGCRAIATEVSGAGFRDTFAFVRREPGILKLLDQRIVAAGYARDDFVTGVYSNAAGDPEGFLRILGEGGEIGGKKFADRKKWVAVQFYLPG